MASYSIEGIEIKGISACVPNKVETVQDLPFVESEAQAQKIFRSTGVFSRHIDNGLMTTSDLCIKAAETLLSELNWKSEQVQALIFLSQSFDYIGVPATSCVIHKRLNLPTTCLAYDIVLGCSGYPYGLSQIFAQLSFLRGKALLLVGDTMGAHYAKHDPVVATLFGAAGTATALEFTGTSAKTYFDLNTDGSGHDVIMIPEGGSRHPFTVDSLTPKTCADGVSRNGINIRMKGVDIINFSLTRSVESIHATLNAAKLTLEDVDYFIFHQANKIILNGIAKKLNLPEEKMLMSLEFYGNTSSASIPITLVHHAKSHNFKHKKLLHGFGVGLSWGTTLIDFDTVHFTDVLRYEVEKK